MAGGIITFVITRKAYRKKDSKLKNESKSRLRGLRLQMEVFANTHSGICHLFIVVGFCRALKC